MELKSAIQFYQVCSGEPLSHQAFIPALDYPQPPSAQRVQAYNVNPLILVSIKFLAASKSHSGSLKCTQNH